MSKSEPFLIHHLKTKALIPIICVSLSIFGCEILNTDKLIDVTPLSNSNYNQASTKIEPIFDITLDKKDIILVDSFDLDTKNDEDKISTLSAFIEKGAKSQEQKAIGYYELGLYYDKLGLEISARTMFINSLVLKPDFADSYNLLGFYLAMQGKYQEAFDALDAAIELGCEFGYLNRGVALIYDKRANLAISDLTKFYKLDTSDPYRLLWLYIAEHEALGDKQALLNLQKRYDLVPYKKSKWAYFIIEYFLENLTKDDFIEALKLKTSTLQEEQGEVLCTAYYYLGKKAEFEKRYKDAYDYYRLALIYKRHSLLEYRAAILDLKKIKDKI